MDPTAVADGLVVFVSEAVTVASLDVLDVVILATERREGTLSGIFTNVQYPHLACPQE